MEATRPLVLSLFRSFIREAKRMPTSNRRDFILQRVRSELVKNRGLEDATEVRFLLQAGEVQLETAALQVVHLQKLKKEGNLKS